MILLPRGNPVKEKIDPGKISLPDALKKLQAGKFTGYLRFDTPQGTGIGIFDQGKLISALFEGPQQQLVAFDALARIFELSLAGGANLDIFRLSTELALSIHALLHGDVLYRGQELKLIDIKALLGRVKEDRMDGCLRIYTQDRIALIFYRDGSPLGFFHDGSTDLETTADTSMSVARLPGAKVDVLSSKSADVAELADLLESTDIGILWQRAVDQSTRLRRQQQEQDNRSQEAQEGERRQKVLALLRTTAERHIGKIGLSLVEKEFEKAGATAGTLTEATFNGFFDNLSKASKLVAGPTAVGTMLDEMKRGLRGQLKSP